MKKNFNENELNELLESFFDKFSYELNTSINTLILSANMLEERLNLYCREERVDTNIDNINISALKILKFTNDIVDFIRVKLGYVKLNVYNYDIVSVIKCLVEDINMYNNKGIDVLVNINTEVQSKKMCFDKFKLERIIINLISNLIKLNKMDKNIFVNISLEGDFVLISVKVKSEFIFEKESNINGVFAKIDEREDFGLALSKELVKIHGGEIRMKNKKNEGCEFIVRIPSIINYNKNIYNYNWVDRVDYNNILRVKMELSYI